MRTPFVLTAALALVAGSALIPTFSAQSADNGDKLVLFFNADTHTKSGTLLSVCGTKRTYNLTEAEAPTARAYLGRSAAEAVDCDTEFSHRVARGAEIDGPARIRFSLGCAAPIGGAQSLKSPVNLRSVELELLRGTTTIASGSYHLPASLPVALCTGGNLLPVDVTTTAISPPTGLDAGDTLNARIFLRAVNAEPELFEYWYLSTGAASNVTVNVTRAPASPPPAPGAPPPTTDPAGGPPPDGAEPPACQREEPESASVTTTPGEAVTLRARCTDPDNDLDKGDWVVDDEVVDEDDLGESPDSSERQFLFDEGTHFVEFRPSDDAGHDGTPATWTVTVEEDPGPSPPSCQRREPEEFEIERPTNTKFLLRARCTDRDNDLESGEWRVNGERVDGQALGESPSMAEREFVFGDECDCRIDFVPKDEAGQVGEPASWLVKVRSDRASPEATPIPFFPSGTGLALGLLGALTGAFLLFRRRPATP